MWQSIRQKMLHLFPLPRDAPKSALPVPKPHPFSLLIYQPKITQNYLYPTHNLTLFFPPLLSFLFCFISLSLSWALVTFFIILSYQLIVIIVCHTLYHIIIIDSFPVSHSLALPLFQKRTERM